MEIKSLKTEEQYRQTLKRLEEIFDAPKGTAESDKADKLALMIDKYEKKHYPFE